MIDDPNKNPGADPSLDDASYYTSPEDRYRESQTAGGDAPAVSAPAAKNFIYIGVFALILIGIIYAFFSGDSKDEPKNTGTVFNPRETTGMVPPIVPPGIIDTPPAPPPIIPLVDNTPPAPTSLFDSSNSSERIKRIKSDMLITRGGVLGGTEFPTRPDGATTSLTEINDNDPGTGFADSFYNQKDAPFAQARKLGDMGRLITQGKIIESILETPINTDVPGMIRAIVNHDIYAESGRAILIPKGSRLVGTYNNFVIRGNKRVNIIWTRVIRPDGIDIMIRSGGADQLGRAGVEGEADNKYTEIFASAFLVSAINIAIATGVDAISNDDITSTTNTDGSTTRNTNAKQEAAIRAVDTFGNAGQNLLDGFLNLKPTITINQGTRVNVFVNRDLIFPANLSGSVKFVK